MEELDFNTIMERLEESADKRILAGMRRFGIETRTALGVSMPELRSIAREAGRNHETAERLWSTGIHEARILAGMIDEPDRVSGGQMDRWTGELDSWDLCDQLCAALFIRTCLAYS